MGYFPNGSAGEAYENQYCSRCIHDKNRGCAVWLAHKLYNYKECNNEASILELLIPRTKVGNGQCTMFMAKEQHHRHTVRKDKLAPHLQEWAQRQNFEQESTK